MTPATADARPAALDSNEASRWVEVLKAMRVGYLRFGSNGRMTALSVVSRVLQRFAVDPTPADWVEALPPTHDVFTAGLADANLDVRVTALVEVGKVWSWTPGSAITRTDEEKLDEWKDGFRAPVVRRLSDREAKSRVAAVACLGYLPIDSAAAPALAYLNDKSSPDVRKQVLFSFSARPALLTEDMILKHMHDTGPGIPEVAETVLRARGLTQDQVSLGSMIFHPKAEMRASVFGLLKTRTDVDPVVWLLQLSHDEDESVRVGAVEALEGRLTPEVGQRLAEMATTDSSQAVRKAANKVLPETMKTALMPPLPGSAGLNPTAN